MTSPASLPDSRPTLRCLSLGAGVQSSAVLLLACDGVIPRFDVALFADTGWEPRAVYENLARLREHAEKFGIPVRTVSAGNIRDDALDPAHRFVSMPLHVLNPDGSRGLARRQCTSEYKIGPLKKAARELLGYPHPRRVPSGKYIEQAIGISTDEFTRAKDSGVRYLRNVFPLIDLGWDRARCVEYLAERGFGNTVKSACVGCLMWNLSELRCLLMITVHWERYRLVEQHPEARRWLQFTANIGRAANTVDAYGRAVDDHLSFCATVGAQPDTAGRTWSRHGSGTCINDPTPTVAWGWRTRPSRCGWWDCGRSMTFLSRKGSGNATQSGAGSPVVVVADPSRAWCGGWTRHRGSPTSPPGSASCGRASTSRCATG
jgi:hypothetical protein